MAPPQEQPEDDITTKVRGCGI